MTPTHRAEIDRDDVDHPPWCDLVACTAQPDPDPRDLRPFGQHVSRPMPLLLGDLSWLFLGVRSATAHLTRTHAPWLCATYLCITGDDGPCASLSIPADDALAVLAVLADLLAADDPDGDPRRSRSGLAASTPATTATTTPTTPTTPGDESSAPWS